MITMKYCIKCGKEIGDNETLCSKCGGFIPENKIQKNKENKEIKENKSVVGIVILIASIPTVSAIAYLFIQLHYIKSNVRNKIYDKDSTIIFKKHYNCKKCLIQCELSSKCSKITDEDCNIIEFLVKDKDVTYTVYYAKQDGFVKYTDNRTKKYNAKTVKEFFKDKYKDYKVDSVYEAKYDRYYLSLEDSLTITIKKYGKVRDILTSELYKDILEHLDSADTIELYLKEDRILIFRKGYVGLGSKNNKKDPYRFNTNTKTYDEIIKMIVERYKE